MFGKFGCLGTFCNETKDLGGLCDIRNTSKILFFKNENEQKNILPLPTSWTKPASCRLVFPMPRTSVEKETL